MIAGFGPFRDNAVQPVPLSVYYDDDAGKYAIEALQAAPAPLKRVRDPGLGARTLRAAYGQPIELRDPDGATVRGYPVHLRREVDDCRAGL